jgi:flagellar M-ring protein FliF
MDVPAGGAGNGTFRQGSVTRDNRANETVEERETAPGAVNTLHVGVVLDATAAAAIQPEALEEIISSAVGINAERGDSIEVTSLPFDRSVEEATAKEIAAAEAAEAAARKNAMLRNIGIGGGIALLVLLAWLQARRRSKAREEATSYLVEQLRSDAANRAPVLESPAMAALEASEADEEDTLRDELIALVEKQPEDVAALLRGWLVEPR